LRSGWAGRRALGRKNQASICREERACGGKSERRTSEGWGENGEREREKVCARKRTNCQRKKESTSEGRARDSKCSADARLPRHAKHFPTRESDGEREGTEREERESEKRCVQEKQQPDRESRTGQLPERERGHARDSERSADLFSLSLALSLSLSLSATPSSLTLSVPSLSLSLHPLSLLGHSRHSEGSADARLPRHAKHDRGKLVLRPQHPHKPGLGFRV